DHRRNVRPAARRRPRADIADTRNRRPRPRRAVVPGECRARSPQAEPKPPANPLELTAAFIFAALFVVISLASAWVRSQFGERGLFGLAAIVGATDIDP